MTSHPVIAVVGPTGVGKSSCAQLLAETLHGAIVSADSMQIYRGMNIGTSKVAPGQRTVPYYLIDIVNPNEAYSAARFQHDARGAIDGLIEAHIAPIVCGGTGLYVRAALDEMDFAPGDQKTNPLRSKWETFHQEQGEDALYAELRLLDPKACEHIHPHNVVRVIRALEMAEHGILYSDQVSNFSRRQAHYETCYIGLTADRAYLYDAIDRRVIEMVNEGLVEEVTSLLELGYRDSLTAAQAIGYKEIVPVIESGASLDDAIAQIAQSTRRYAKRQLTWFRADTRIQWLDTTNLSSEQVAEQALNLVTAFENSGVKE